MVLTTLHGQAGRRCTAAIALAAFAVILAPRPIAAGEHTCPQPAPASVAVAPPAEHCHHAQAGPCGDMLGCLATPVAVLTAPGSVEPSAAAAMAPPAAPPAGHGRLATGPPPPPPDF